MSAKVSRAAMTNLNGAPETGVVSTGSRRKVYAPTRSADDSQQRGGLQQDNDKDVSFADWEKVVGGPAPVVGLENLGNTCFMNSSLQQLLHVQPLVEYFMRDDVLSKINKRSCRNGVLCASFSQLCKDVIKAGSTSTKSIAPVKFKKAVAQYAPYLLDFQQQDCHEFLRFLLDGLSEDMCRSILPDKKVNTPKPSPAKGATPGSSDKQQGSPQSPAKTSLSEKLRGRVVAARSGSGPGTDNPREEVEEVAVSSSAGDGSATAESTITTGLSAMTTSETTAVEDGPEAHEEGTSQPQAQAQEEEDKDKDKKKEEEEEEEENLTLEEQAGKAWAAHLRMNDSIITDLFAGLLMSAVECQTCHNITRNFEPFLDLSVSIPRAESKSLLQKTLRATGATSDGGGGQATLDACLSQYTASEKLEDMVTCEKCKQKRKAVKRMSIYRCPKVLVVSIKRFYFKDMMHRQKISTHVNFKSGGEGLDLSPFLTETVYAGTTPPLQAQVQAQTRPQLDMSRAGQAMYDLLSISNHAGAGMNGGHYFAYVDLNRWTQAGGGSGGTLTNSVQPQSPVRASSLGAVENGAARSSSTGQFTPTPPSYSKSLSLPSPSSASSQSQKESDGGGSGSIYGKGYKGKWVVCDDERVQRIKSVDGAGSSAYMLFWRLRE